MYFFLKGYFSYFWVLETMSLVQVRSQVCMAPFYVRSQVCIAPINVRNKFANFAQHMEGSHADYALHMERRHSFREQKNNLNCHFCQIFNKFNFDTPYFWGVLWPIWPLLRIQIFWGRVPWRTLSHIYWVSSKKVA